MCFQRADADLTFDEVGADASLSRSPERIRRKRQFWDTWGESENDDNYDDYAENDYNGNYDDYNDYNGLDNGQTASGDGLPPQPPTMPTDDEDLVQEGSGPTTDLITPRVGVRPTKPVPTAPTGLGE